MSVVQKRMLDQNSVVAQPLMKGDVTPITVKKDERKQSGDAQASKVAVVTGGTRGCLAGASSTANVVLGAAGVLGFGFRVLGFEPP